MLKQMRSEQICVPTILASGNFLPGDLINVGIPGLTALMKPYSIVDLLALAKATLPPADRGTDTGIA